MADRRGRDSADNFKELTDRIAEERRKIEEAVAAIAEYSAALHRVAADTERRLLTRD